MVSRVDAFLSRMETRMDDLTFSVQQLTSLVIPPRQRGDLVTPIDTSLEVDGGTKVISLGFDTRASAIAHETMPILWTSSDVVARIFTSIIDILDSARQVDGEIFIQAIDITVDIIISDDPPMVQDGGEAVTPILEITNHDTTSMLENIDQVATHVLEEIDGVVDPIIGA